MGERTRLSVEGAGATAPTAPHATPPREPADERTGPARFWSARHVKRGLVFGVVASVLFHWLISPLSVLPQGPPIEVHDQSGDLSIPVDFISEGTGDTPGKKSSDSIEHGGNGGTTAGAGDAAVDAPEGDAADQGLDAGADGESDGSSEEAGTAWDDGGMIAVADGGVGRDPQSILGAAAAVSAGPNNITILVNFVELRKHPDAARLGMVLGGIPQWRAFMSDAAGAPLLDPMRDADWMIIMGPSLLDTKNDAVFVHYSTPDATVDKIIDTVSHRYARGGRIDVGVPRVKAWKAFADNGERVFLRPSPHVAVIVPSSHARQFAAVLARNPVTPRVRPGEAFSMRALRPGGSVNVIPQDIREMRMWIIPRPSDGGGDLYAEADCPSDDAAKTNAESLRTLIQQKNVFAVRLFTAGFLNKVDITTRGPTIELHINGTQQQIEALLALAAGRVGVTLPPPTPHP
ncbi:MAG TPA: hypothetical protein VGH28_14175 [Polyangiaceae bacterium]